MSPMPHRPVNDAEVVSTMQRTFSTFEARFRRTITMVQNFLVVFQGSIPVDAMVHQNIVDEAMKMEDPTTPGPEAPNTAAKRSRMFFENVYADVPATIGGETLVSMPRPMKRQRTTAMAMSMPPPPPPPPASR